MILATFAGERKKAIFEALSEGLPPAEGAFNETLFKEAKDKGRPQMGATRFTSSTIVFEFIYVISNGAPIILSVTLEAPERIVFMPVPEWVVVSIWEGEVSGRSEE